MAKKVAGYLKLQVPAGSATPSPPIGPALGQRGINIMEFCKSFNAKSQDMEKGSPVPVEITYYQDKSFTFEMKTPPVSFFLKKAANLQKGSQTPGRGVAGTVSKAQVRDIADEEDEGPQRRRRRGGDEDGRRLGPVDGPPGDGVRAMASTESVSGRPARASIAPSSIRSTRR